MADRARPKTSGGGNFTIVCDIDTGNNAVSTLTPMIFDMNFTSAIGALLTGKSGATVTINQEKNSPDLTTWLSTRISEAEDSAETNYYEDGEGSVTGSSDIAKLFFVTVGAASDGKRQIWYGCCKLSIGDGTLENKKSFIRDVTLTTVAWNGSADLTIPVGLWGALTKKDGTTKFLDTAAPDPAFPTVLAKDKASTETWLKAL